jgi:quercetin dioxygenase-like cupin family protein
MMNGIAKQAAFYRGYLADESSLVPLTILLAAAVPLWLLVYLVGAAADTRQDTYAASASYAPDRQAADFLVRCAALSPRFPVPLCDGRKQKDASMPYVDLKIPEPAADEIFDVLGPRIRFLTALSNHDDDYCLIAGVVPAGVVVPVHSHPERETFYVLEGEIEGLMDKRWATFGAGDVVDVPGGLRHAWRNTSGAPAQMLCVTPMRLGRFFRDIAVPLALATQGPPTPADLQRMVGLTEAYGYWLGGPADNAAVGISIG